MEAQKINACKHCRRLSEADFCCSGCAVAYQLIHQSGLDQYYQLRDKSIVSLNRSDQVDDQTTWSVSVVSPARNRIKVRLSGVDCPACSWLIERTPMIDQRLISARFSTSDSVVTVDFVPSASPIEIVKLYRSLGFQVRADISPQGVYDNLKLLYLRAGIALGSWISSMHLGLTLVAGQGEYMDPGLIQGVSWFSFVISLPTLTFSALPFYRNTLLSIKTRVLNIDFMVSLSLVLGTVLGLWNLLQGVGTNYFEALNMLVFCLLLSRAISFWWETKSREQIHDSQKASLSEWLKPYASGEKLSIRTSEMVPADGIILSGTTWISQSWLTGEQAAIQRSVGEEVLAGSINERSPIEISVIRSGHQTKVGQLIENWKSIHTPLLHPESRKWESRFILGTLITIIILFILRGASGVWDFKYAITLLIVACPCALGIAIPLGYASAVAQSLRHHFFVQSGDALEKLSQATDIVFDKTGTVLTSDSIRWTIESEDLETTQKILGALPRYNLHPLTQSFLNQYSVRQNAIEKVQLTDFLVASGEGVLFKYLGEIYSVGKPTEYETTLEMRKNGKIFARLISDQRVEPEAIEWFRRLQTRYRVWLSTGDPSRSGSQLGEILGLPKDQVLVNQRPQDKLSLVKRLHDEKRVVVMVGDGVNDILAFKEADVRIGVGSQLFQALENCDIFIRSLPIQSIQTLLVASRKLKSQVIISLLWAVVYNAIGFYLITQGWIGPVVCALLMPLSSITVSSLAFKKQYFSEVTS